MILKTLDQGINWILKYSHSYFKRNVSQYYCFYCAFKLINAPQTFEQLCNIFNIPLFTQLCNKLVMFLVNYALKRGKYLLSDERLKFSWHGELGWFILERVTSVFLPVWHQCKRMPGALSHFNLSSRFISMFGISIHTQDAVLTLLPPNFVWAVCFLNEVHVLCSRCSSEVFRLNLEQGRFLNSLQTDAA